MSRIYVLIMALLVGFVAISQENEVMVTTDEKDEFKTIVGNSELGGYGGVSVGYSLIEDRNAAVFSGRGGVILGHTLAMGFGGTGFINEYKDDLELNRNASLAGGYGGIFFEIIALPKFPVHLSFPVLLGVGGIAYTTWDDSGDEFEEQNYTEDAQAFLIAEPMAELEFNFTNFFRFAVYGSYRFTSELDMYNTDKYALEGFSGGVVFKFGKF